MTNSGEPQDAPSYEKAIDVLQKHAEDFRAFLDSRASETATVDWVQRWVLRVHADIASRVGPKEARTFKRNAPSRSRTSTRHVSLKQQFLSPVLGLLEELRDHPDAVSRREAAHNAIKGNARTQRAADSLTDSAEADVFLIHGHDEARKSEVADFIEVIHGQRPTILHEQPDGGQTIIEKLERYARRATFAVAILSADDRGGAHRSPPPEMPKKEGLHRAKGGEFKLELRPRARQNVVLELGYFWARLTRERVVILYEEGVELPSDAHGVLYTLLDSHGHWRRSLANEMTAAGLPVDLSKSTEG